MKIKNFSSYCGKFFSWGLWLTIVLAHIMDYSISISSYLCQCQSATASVYSLKVIAVSTFCAIFFPNARHMWGWSIVLHYKYFCLGLFLGLWGLMLLSSILIAFFIISSSLLSLVLSITFSTLCASTVLAKLSTCSLVLYLAFLSWLILLCLQSSYHHHCFC